MTAPASSRLTASAASALADETSIAAAETRPHTAIASPMRLALQHFALYRAYLDGLPDAQLHAIYGEPGTDVRLTRKRVTTIRDTLLAVAQRRRDKTAVRLLQLAPEQLNAPKAAETTLASAVITDSPDAPDIQQRRQHRNARLRRNQAEALFRLEAALAETPQREHAVDGWFERPLAQRLAAVGVLTLEDLLSLIRLKLHRLYRTVPRLYGLAPGVVALTGLSGRGVPTGTMLGGILSDWAIGVPEQDLHLRVEPLHQAPRWMDYAPAYKLREMRLADNFMGKRGGIERPPHY